MKKIISIIIVLIILGCKDKTKFSSVNDTASKTTGKYPIDIFPHLKEWKILLGDGTQVNELTNYERKDFFYVAEDEDLKWVVYKTPNSGITSRTSSNTRSELRHKKEWTPEVGGQLTGRLKVKHVSTSGDARVAASFSVVVGQIHSHEGHKNEPLKIVYKKFPGHTKGSVYWNYEINTEGSNTKRWDYSTAVWGYDMSVVGEAPTSYPKEPENGIALNEEFTYAVNVYRGVMYLTFTSKNHESRTFTKSLIKSTYTDTSHIPKQTVKLFGVIGQDGTERDDAYAGELQYFKQGAYNQTNGKDPEKNIVWNTGSKIYNGNITKQYENGSYAEVWFKESTVGIGKKPNQK